MSSAARSVLAVISGVVFAAAAQASSDMPEWALNAGGEYGRDSSRGSMVSLDYSATPGAADVAPGQLAAGIAGSHTDAPSAAGGTVSSTGLVHVGYGSDHLRGGIAFDDTRDDGYRGSTRFTGTVDGSWARWKGELSIATRRTRFDEFPTQGESAFFPGVQSAAESVSCTLRDTGYGASLGYSWNPWNFYASGTVDHYDAAVCSLGVAMPPVSARALNFQSLAGDFLGRNQIRVGGQIGLADQLLKSQYAAGVSRAWGRFSLSLDYVNATDEFESITQNGYSLSGTIPLGRSVAMKLAGGTTVANSVSTPYTGLYASVSW